MFGRLLKRLLVAPTPADSIVVWKKWTIDIAGRPVRVQVELDSPNVDPEPCMDFSTRLIDALVRDDAKFRATAANELTAIYNNDGWNNGEPVSKSDFASRLSLMSVLVTVTDDDCFGSVTYEADEMFTEHTVHLMVGSDLEIQEIEVS